MAKIARLLDPCAISCDSSGSILIFMSPPSADRTDRAILSTLQRDGRIANIDLADAVSLSPSACLRRVKALAGRGGERDRVSEIDVGDAAIPLQRGQDGTIGAVCRWGDMKIRILPEVSHDIAQGSSNRAIFAIACEPISPMLDV